MTDPARSAIPDPGTVFVNGEPAPLPVPATVGALVAAMAGSAGGGGRGRGIAVALNGEVVARSAWDSTDLRPGDRVEVLTAAQGG